MDNNPAYPVFLRLKGEAALVVGGGKVGLRKVRGLVECGARVTVVSLGFMEEMGKIKRVRRVAEAYGAKHMTMEKWRLVFAATDMAAVNERVAAEARAAGIWCCRCDEAEAGDFVGGAVARLGKTGAVTVAVNSGGASPVIAGIMLASAKSAIAPSLVEWAELMAGWRRRVKARVNGTRRGELLRALGGAEMEETLARGGRARAEQLFRRWLRAAVAGGAGEARGTPGTTTARRGGARAGASRVRGKTGVRRGG